MSSFTVSRETVNRVCHLLDLDCDNQASGGRFLSRESANQIGGKLWALNAAATAHRYRESPYAVPKFTFAYSLRYSVFELIKAARCWLYQCCEGEEFRSHDLYQLVLKRVQHAEQRIVSRMVEYETAEWNAEPKGGAA